MEVPYEREAEEVIGAEEGLQTRRRSSQSQPPINTNSSTSSDSSFTSESSDSSFQYSIGMNTNENTNENTTVTATNGENPKIIEDRSVIEEADEEEATFEEPNKRENDINLAHNGDGNGFIVKQTGVDAIEYFLPDSNGGNNETTIVEPIISSFSKSSETDVGLKYVESLLDESSNGINGTSPEIFNAENIVNKTLIVNGHTEIVEEHSSEDLEPEGEEYDVERVVREQKTHDFICPHCHKDITDRVILKRRKRKFEKISKDAPEVKPGQLTPMHSDGVLDTNNVPAPKEKASDSRINAISCFSCFSIFIPKGDGFLCWRFKPKPAITLHSDDPPSKYTDLPEQGTDSETVRTAFPYWILTCCQPYHTEKPDETVPKPELKSPPTSEKGKEDLPHNSEFSSPPSHVAGVHPNENQLPSSPSHVSDVLPHEIGLTSPPTRDTPVPYKSLPPTHEPDLPPSSRPVEGAGVEVLTNETGADVYISTHEKKSPLAPSDDPPMISKPLTPISPVDDNTGETKSPPEQQPLTASDEGKDSPFWFLTCCQPATEKNLQKQQDKTDPAVITLESEYPSPPSKDISVSTTQPIETPGNETQVPPVQKPRVTSEEGTCIPLWFLTCCQPSTDGTKPKPLKKPGEVLPSSETNTSPTLEDDPGVEKHERESSPVPSDDTPALQISQPPIIFEPGQLILPKPISPKIPGEDIPSSPELPEAPSTPPKGEEVIVQISDLPKPQTSDMQPGASGSRPSTNVIDSLLGDSRVTPRPGVSGVEIIKAIVYGGLLECITSLSIITSAAGGDATTLNIVALGLANVFGGLIVLLHNLRVLKHEHGTERYEDQLGRSGHFLLHAVVAVLSYLVFGLMSPLIYGFAFRKSDNKDYKLATLVAASLVCIAFLSIGKAYARRPPKAYFQTIFYYLSLGFMVSGVGYVAGDLINMLLKKLGVFDSRAPPVAIPVLGAGAVNGAWSAY